MWLNICTHIQIDHLIDFKNPQIFYSAFNNPWTANSRCAAEVCRESFMFW